MVDNKKLNTLWVEKYRPQNLDEFVGNDSVKEKIGLYLESNDVPHLLLYGSAGTGKTTIAKMIAKLTDCDYLYVNASDENSVDVMRNKIRDFACSVGFKTYKLIILDECLDENTLVWVLRDGVEQSIPIKDLNENGDLVRSYNLDKNEIQFRPFNMHNVGDAEVYELELETGERVICTDTHKWYVEIDGKIEEMKLKDIISNGIDTIISY